MADNEDSSKKFSCVRDFENYAYKNLPKSVLDYYGGGSLSEHTLRINEESFKK